MSSNSSIIGFNPPVQFGGFCSKLKRKAKGLFNHRKIVLESPEGIPDKTIIGQAPSSTASSQSFTGIAGSAGSIAGLAFGVLTLLGCAFSIKKDIREIINAKAKIKHILQNASRKAKLTHKLAMRRIARAKRNIARNAVCIAATVASIIQGSAATAIHFSPAASAAGFAIVFAASVVIVPISLYLSYYGIRRNIRELKQTSKKLDLVKQEISRLGQKYNGGEVQNWSKNDRERMQLLQYAKNKLEDRHLRRIVGIAENALLMAGAIFIAIGLLSGPGITTAGTIGFVLMGCGALGGIAARGIIAFRRWYCNKKLREENPLQKQVSGSELRQRTIRHLKISEAKRQSIDFNAPPADWKNHELMLYLLMPSGHHKSPRKKLRPEEFRGMLLLEAKEGRKEEWSRALS